MTLEEIGSRAKAVSRTLNNLGSREKNIGLEEAARALLEGEDEILAANQADYEKAESSGMSKGMLDRLALNPGRIQSMADGLLKVAALDDPVGEVISMKLRPNGLKIGQKRVPLGVIAMIYEARPNVTADAFGLCFKSGNAVILKGGSDAIESNKAIAKWLRTGLTRAGLPEDALQLIEDTSRETTKELIANLVDEDSELISIYYGEEVSEEEAEKFAGEIEELYPDVDVDIQFGGQPIYYYVLAVE